jgi:hypothetical protein
VPRIFSTIGPSLTSQPILLGFILISFYDLRPSPHTDVFPPRFPTKGLENKFYHHQSLSRRIIGIDWLISVSVTSALSVSVKVVPVLNWTPCQEDVLGWRYSSTHSLTLARGRGKWSALRHGPLTPGVSAPATLSDRRVDGSQRRSGNVGEEWKPH